MPDYRRAFVPGGTFFFTVVTADRRPLLGDARAIRFLREAFSATQARWSFSTEALVVLPDHVHTIWTLPNGDSDFSKRWAFLKKSFTRVWLAHGGAEQRVSPSQDRDRRRGVWQRKFWEHTIRDATDFERHCDYIYYNPVRHGLVRCPHAWPYSTFRRAVERNLYALDWLCVCNNRCVQTPEFGDVAATAIE